VLRNNLVGLIWAHAAASSCDRAYRISLWPRFFQIDGNFVGLARESLLVHHQEVHALGRVRYQYDQQPP